MSQFDKENAEFDQPSLEEITSDLSDKVSHSLTEETIAGMRFYEWIHHSGSVYEVIDVYNTTVVAAKQSKMPVVVAFLKQETGERFCRPIEEFNKSFYRGAPLHDQQTEG